MIEKLKNTFNIQNSIPTAYDDSLTFYEVISKLMKKINECVDLVQGKQYGKINELIDDRNDTIVSAINDINSSTSTSFIALDVTTKSNNENLSSYFTGVNDSLVKNNQALSSYASTAKKADSSFSDFLSEYNHVVMKGYDEDTRTLSLVGHSFDGVNIPSLSDLSKNPAVPSLESHDTYVPHKSIDDKIEKITEDDTL